MMIGMIDVPTGQITFATIGVSIAIIATTTIFLISDVLLIALA